MGDCPKAAKDHRVDVAFSRIILVALFPLWCVGGFVGMVYGALRAGFCASARVWSSAVEVLRDKSGS
jgi:hypothetical protein